MDRDLATVQEIYAAFGRGDLQSILDRISPDVEWEYGQGGSDVPYLAPRRGHAGVVAFFGALAETLRLDVFRPKDLVAGPGVVVALVDIEGVSLRTGRSIREEDEVHVWRFDDAGKVARFRHALDTAAHARAHAPATAP